MARPRRARAQAAKVQDFAFLGREFLTWLLWRIERGEDRFGSGAETFTLAFGSRVRLRALAGDVTDAVLRGAKAAYSVEARAGVGAGRTLREAELRLIRGDREWRFTLDGETLDLRGVKLPALLAEEDDDRFLERVALIDELDSLVKSAFSEFIRERTRPVWHRSVVPAMQAWVAEGLRVDPRFN